MYKKFSSGICADRGMEIITSTSECLTAMQKAVGVYTDGIKKFTNSISKPEGCYTEGQYAYMNSADGSCNRFDTYCLCKFSGPICSDGDASTPSTEKCICSKSVCAAGEFCALHDVNACFTSKQRD